MLILAVICDMMRQQNVNNKLNTNSKEFQVSEVNVSHENLSLRSWKNCNNELILDAQPEKPRNNTGMMSACGINNQNVLEYVSQL